MKKTFAKVLKNRYFQIIPEPKLRSKRWISSNNSDRLEKGTDKYDRLFARCSAEYLASNMCGPVMFYNALKKVPENAITVEICPHGLLQVRPTFSLVLITQKQHHVLPCACCIFVEIDLKRLASSIHKM